MINSNMLPEVFFHYFDVLGTIAILTTPTAFITNVIVVVVMYCYNVFCLNFNFFYRSETLFTVQPMVFFLLLTYFNFQFSRLARLKVSVIVYTFTVGMEAAKVNGDSKKKRNHFLPTMIRHEVMVPMRIIPYFASFSCLSFFLHIFSVFVEV